MRLMFVAPPNLGMVFPLVPLAHAAVTAGHDVIFATASHTVGAGPGSGSGQGSGDNAVRLIAESGLHAADVAPDADFAALAPDATQAFLSNRPDAAPVVAVRPHFFQRYADAMADGAVRLAQRWRPDAVVHPPEGVVARAVFDTLRIPNVWHGIGFAHHPDLMEPWKRLGSERVADAGARRWGQLTAIDVSPPSMSLVEGFGERMRPVPYSGGAALPDWLVDIATPSRPRIAVTIGTVAPGIVGADPLRWLLTAAGDVDAEFVCALGGAEPDGFGELPENVRVVRWVPLTALLPTCAAVAHHGGAGSTMAALHAGLPQLLLPQGADQFDNARAISERGVGFVASTAESAVAVVRRLLTDHALRRAAGEVRQELHSMPGPAAVAAQLAERLDSA